MGLQQRLLVGNRWMPLGGLGALTSLGDGAPHFLLHWARLQGPQGIHPRVSSHGSRHTHGEDHTGTWAPKGAVPASKEKAPKPPRGLAQTRASCGCPTGGWRKAALEGGAVAGRAFAAAGCSVPTGSEHGPPGSVSQGGIPLRLRPHVRVRQPPAPRPPCRRHSGESTQTTFPVTPGATRLWGTARGLALHMPARK